MTPHLAATSGLSRMNAVALAGFHRIHRKPPARLRHFAPAREYPGAAGGFSQEPAMAKLEVAIDPEFRDLLRPLSKLELQDLRENLVADGCKEEFVYCVLDGKNIQLDGHHRRQLCDEIPLEYFGWRKVYVKDREGAKDWIRSNQKGRRNLSAKEVKFLRGKKYLESKKPAGRPKADEENKCAQNEHISGRTAEQLAQEAGVSAATIRRDAEEAAKIIEQLCDRCKRIGKPACDECRKLLEEKPKPAPKKEEPPPPPPEDAEGHKLPKRLIPTFETVAKFKEADSLCAKLQKLIDELSRCEGGEQLRFFLSSHGDDEKTIRKSEHLQMLKRDLKGTRPHSVCPNCSGRGCNTCNKSGWVTKTTYDTCDDKAKEKLK
jgi:hypothetical protein